MSRSRLGSHGNGQGLRHLECVRHSTDHVAHRDRGQYVAVSAPNPSPEKLNKRAFPSITVGVCVLGFVIAFIAFIAFLNGEDGGPFLPIVWLGLGIPPILGIVTIVLAA